mmetsp:Transcript_33407/g.48894  ORF Transcript_33407/g.48894 Transcript_33407/m.48894 type:complete len:213 (+) Transcript_33407:411-1049(+)
MSVYALLGHGPGQPRRRFRRRCSSASASSRSFTSTFRRAVDSHRAALACHSFSRSRTVFSVAWCRRWTSPFSLVDASKICSSSNSTFLASSARWFASNCARLRSCRVCSVLIRSSISARALACSSLSEALTAPSSCLMRFSSSSNSFPLDSRMRWSSRVRSSISMLILSNSSAMRASISFVSSSIFFRRSTSKVSNFRVSPRTFTSSSAFRL